MPLLLPANIDLVRQVARLLEETGVDLESLAVHYCLPVRYRVFMRSDDGRCDSLTSLRGPGAVEMGQVPDEKEDKHFLKPA